MCYITEAGKLALGVFVMLDEARISALGGKRVKDRNVKTITKKQEQLLLLGSRSFITVLCKESVRQSSEGPWVED